jgi:hypothetical protein
MVTRPEFEEALSKAPTPGERVALLGALLARESGLGDRLVVVGGSAISVYTDSAYVSKDIDIVAKKERITPVLRRWGFGFDERQGRGYWVRDDLRIMVDLINRSDYVGLTAGTGRRSTPAGPVRIAAVEDLILRRLIFAKRGRNPELLNQATLLWLRYGRELDTEYLESQSRYEDVEDLYLDLKQRATTTPNRLVSHDESLAKSQLTEDDAVELGRSIRRRGRGSRP